MICVRVPTRVAEELHGLLRDGPRDPDIAVSPSSLRPPSTSGLTDVDCCLSAPSILFPLSSDLSVGSIC
jgi:hypothetical protein